jgi:WD40 repeat protein
LTYQPFLDRVLHSGVQDPEIDLTYSYTSPSRVAFSPDSSIVAVVTADNTIVLWDVATGARVDKPLTGHIKQATALAFSPDGTILAAGNGLQTVLLWDVKTGELIGNPLQGSVERDPEGHFIQALWGINSLVFSPDGERIIAGCGNEDIIVWDVATGERFEEHLGQQPTGVPHWLHATALSPDVSIMASGLEDGSVALYDVMTGRRVGIKRLAYEGPSRFTALAYSPDSLMVAGGDIRDDTVILWDLTADVQVAEPLEGHSSDITTLAFSPDGLMLASAGWDTTIVLLDVETGEAIGDPLTGHTAKVIGLGFSPDGRWLASLDILGNTLLWNVAGEGVTFARRFDGDSRANAIAFDALSDEKTLVSARCGGGSDDWECVVRRWDVATGTESADPIKVYWSEVVYPELSPDGAIMVTSGDLRVVLWDTRTGEQLIEPVYGRKPMAFNPVGESLAIWMYHDALYSTPKTVSRWDMNLHQPIGDSLSGTQDDLSALAYSYDGGMLAGGSRSGEVVLWDIVSGNPAPRSFITRDEGEVIDLAFSPDGRLLAAASEGAPVGDATSIDLWDVATGQSLSLAASDQPEDVNSLIFSPDGMVLVSKTSSRTTEEKTLTLWDVASGRMIGRLGNGGDELLFSTDGGKLITAGSSIILWDVSLEAWQAHACHIANRNMTADEWATYLPDQPCRPTCSNLPGLCASD